MRQTGTLSNAKNFFKGIQTLMDDSLASTHQQQQQQQQQHSRNNNSRTTSKPFRKSEATASKKRGGRKEYRKEQTSKVCGELNDRLALAMIGLRALEIGRFSSFRL